MKATRDLGRKPPSTAPASAAPMRVGRYTIVEEVGAGAMGVVFAAYDPKLDRRVALKALHPTEDDRSEARLLSEARAMARLSHPNVVSVHDVLTDAEHVYITMDYVEGGTLRDWVGASEPSAGGKLDGLRQAGAGLAAAHRAGIVHRDFKPDNVLVGTSGEVRVTDFGLAAAEPTASELELLRSDAEPAALPRSHGLLGTPLYMAPEQFEGRPADARSDQFAFCVTALEVLHGRQPFAAGSLLQRYDAVRRCELIELPEAAGVASSTTAALVRGLDPDPAHRWPDMDALLLALQPRRRGALWLGATVATVACGGAVFGWAWLSRDVCGTPAHLQADALPADAREQAAAALRATDLPYADDTATRVDASLQTYAEQWALMRVETCERFASGEEPETIHDRRVACLDGRRRQLHAVLSVLRGADADTTRNAATMVRSIGGLERCANAAWLLGEVPPPDPVIADRVEQLRDDLAAAEARMVAGNWNADDAPNLVARAAALEYGPVHARALMLHARLADSTLHHEQAHALLLDAYALSEREGSESQRLIAASLLVRVNAQSSGLRPEEAEPWAHVALALAERVGASAPASRAFLAAATLRKHQGRFDDAHELLRRALELSEATFGDAHPTTASILNNIGSIYVDQRQYVEALPYLERGLSTMEEVSGPQHPDVASARYNLGATYGRMGRTEDARAHIQAAAAVWRAVFGPDHPRMGVIEFGLAEVEDGAGNYEAAISRYLDAATQWERDPERNASHLAAALNNAASLLQERGEAAAARPHALRALELQTMQGANAHGIAETRVLVADIERDEGNLLAAREQAAAAVATFEELGDAVGLGAAHSARGAIMAELDDPTAAAADYARALGLAQEQFGEEDARVAPALRRLAEFELSRAPDRAHALIERAVALLAAAPDSVSRHERVAIPAARAEILEKVGAPGAAQARATAMATCAEVDPGFVSACDRLVRERDTVPAP